MSDQPPTTPAGQAFATLLLQDTHAFEEVYVCAFELLDHLWLSQQASYFDFPVLIQAALDTVKVTLQTRPDSLEDFRAACL